MKKTGTKAALDVALAEKPPPTLAEQLEFFGLPNTAKVRRALAQHPKIGRPEGSKNRRTVEMADYLLSQFTSPLVALARIYSTPVEVLAAALQCTKLEALQEIRLAAIAVKDHVHPKMPVAVNVNNREIHLHIVETLPVSDAGGIGLVDGLVDLVPQVVDEPKA